MEALEMRYTQYPLFLGSAPQREDATLQHPDSRLKTSDSRLNSPDPSLQSPVSSLQTPDSRLQTPDSRLKTPDSRLKTQDSRLQTPDSRLQTPDSRLSPLFPAAAGLAAFALPFSLYLRTLCPTIYPGDGPELTAAAWVLGVPHPTGYPLFMVCGHLFQRIGLGTPAFSMNLMTALFGALACLGACFLQREIWRVVVGQDTARHPAFSLISAATALLLGASATWWDQSNETEVYSLMLVFVSLAWTLGLRTIREPSPGRLLALAALSGTAFLHHLIFLITLPLSAAAALAFWKKPENAARRARVLAAALLCFCLPLLGYLYLPIRAAARPAINSGDPRTLGQMVQHMTGGQFRPTRILTRQDAQGFHKIGLGELPAHAGSRILELLYWMDVQVRPLDPRKALGEQVPPLSSRGPVRPPVLGIIICVVAGFGLVRLHQSSRLGAWGLALGFLLNLALVIVYTIPDIQPYQIPLWMLLCILAPVGGVAGAEIFSVSQSAGPPVSQFAGPPVGQIGRIGQIGLSSIFHFFNPQSAIPNPQLENPQSAIPNPQFSALQPRRVRGAWVGAGFLAALAAYSVVNWFSPALGVNKSEDTHSYDYARKLMTILPPNAVVFTHGDYDIYPLWYIQACEKMRPDVAVLGSNFVLYRWYAAMLRANLPEGVEVFVGNEPPSNQGRWLVAFLGGMVAPQIQAGRPVYMTSPQPGDASLIARHFRLKPVFQVPSPYPDPGADPLIILEVQDPDNFAATARLRLVDMFGPYSTNWVRREKRDFAK